MSSAIRGEPLVDGAATGEIIRLDQALSFWGGFDPARGVIIDQAHPQVGQSLVGKIVLMPGSRGSSGTPGVLGESIRRGTGPAALIITTADRNVLAGALVARTLYNTDCPVIRVESLDAFDGASHLTITSDGTIS